MLHVHALSTGSAAVQIPASCMNLAVFVET
jgi:hypothetical protein